MLRKIYLTLEIIVLSAVFSFAQNTSVISSNLIDSHINSMVQDKDGYIWMGTVAGLSRFNGSNYLNYYPSSDPKTLNSGNIRNLMYDAQGRLWIATDINLSILSPGGVFNTAKGECSSLSRMIDYDEYSFIATQGGSLVRVDKNSLQITNTYQQSTSTPYVPYTVSQEDGHVWVGVNDKHNPKIEILDALLNPIYSFNIESGIMVRTMFFTGTDEDRLLWLSTNKGFRVISAKTYKQQSLPSGLSSLYRENDYILFFRPYTENTFLIGLRGKGIFSYNYKTNTSEHLFPYEKLNDNRYTVLVDSQYNVWLSDMKSGFTRYRYNTEISNLCDSYQINTSVSDIDIDKEGRLWTLTSFTDVSNVDFENSSMSESKPVFGCLDVMIDEDGFMWRVENYSIITKNEVSQGNVHMLESFSLPENVYSIAKDKKTGYIVLLLSNRVAILNPETADIRYVYSEGRLVSMDSYYDNDRIFLYSENMDIYELKDAESLVKLDVNLSDVSTLYPETEGGYWAGTVNDGLYYLDKDFNVIDHYTNENGLADNSIKSIIEDKEGNIWFSSMSKIGVYNKATSKILIVDNDEISNIAFRRQNVVIDKNGTLYFAGDGGIAEIDADSPLLGTKIDLPLYLDAIVSGNNKLSYKGTEPLVFTYKDNTITFHYGTLSYMSCSNPVYSIKLEGRDKDWTLMGNDSQVTYTSLSGGRYTFHVKVMNDDGTWSVNEIAVPFRVKPAPWLSWGAIVFYFLILLLLVSYIYNKSVNSKLKRERRLIAAAFMMHNKAYLESGNVSALPESVDEQNQEPESEDSAKSDNNLDEDSISEDRKEFERQRDIEYIEKVNSIIERNISDENFNVNALASEMCISYNRLYMRVREITGKTPKMLIESYRMNAAIQLLKTHKYTINEVSAMVGFSAPSNFSRSFKQYFGISPGKV